MKKVLFLDLEETIIDEWGNFNILSNNIRKIKTFIDVVKPDEMSIWSFAVWSQRDISCIEDNGLLNQLEENLNFKINKIFTIQEMQKIVEQFNGFKFENEVEFIQLCGKQWSFIKFALTHKDMKFWLIDDIISNMTIKNSDLNVEIELINVHNL